MNDALGGRGVNGESVASERGVLLIGYCYNSGGFTDYYSGGY